MRVYVPASLPLLGRLAADGSWAAPVLGYAVTALLREWSDASGPSDEEELELVAFSEAARGSLRVLGADPAETAAPRRRVVVAIDTPAEVEVRLSEGSEGDAPGRVVVEAAVRLEWVRAVHVDDGAAESDVRAAVEAVAAADEGDEQAEALVSRADDHELLWYAPAELPTLLGVRVDEGQGPRTV